MLVLGSGAENAHRCKALDVRKMGLFDGAIMQNAHLLLLRGQEGVICDHFSASACLLSAVRPRPGVPEPVFSPPGVSSLLLPIIVLRPRMEWRGSLQQLSGVDPHSVQDKSHPVAHV